MPIFELDAGHPILVQPMQPAAGTFPADTSSVVADHLGSLLGEQLFPISTRQPGADGPHLLAVDAAGQPVVVEVVQMLDADALVRALRFAGAAARLSSADLARAYHSGPERFATELVAFRENVPVAVVHAAARHAGARLLLVCSEVAESVVDAVEFLRQAGRQVEVLQVGVLRGADGRRYVDVSPLVPQVPARRAVEPSALGYVQPLQDPDRARDAGRDATLEMSNPGASGARAAAPTPRAAVPAPRSPAPAAGDDWRRAMAQRNGQSDDRTELRPADHPGHHRTSGRDPSATGALTPAEAFFRAGPVPSSGASAPTGTFPSVLPVPVGRALPLPPVADGMLAAFATALASATTLVWYRERRNQRLVATLRLDGLIQLPNGAVFADPDIAASAAAGSDTEIDGWSVWRVGDSGPTLADVRDT
ncbi:hypothetical protein [Pengzhenrongella sp.]|jgi:hypothetical protein|uniref:restriction system modified-DNA reader domain-containing protein n=1 Tax=Pengzhenrongella sp. TaxID=2888820 RepID=UPI002F91D056